MSLESLIQDALGADVLRVTPLVGGCIAEVHRAALADERTVVLKVDRSERPRLDLEGRMLTDLSTLTSLPVPAVLFSEPHLLIMEDVPSTGSINADSERHAADLLADLHDIHPPGKQHFGYDYDTLIGPLDQPNPWTASWIDFFREQRLLAMAHAAAKAGRLPASTHRRLQTLANRLDDLLLEPEHPSFIHGDVWSGNVLAGRGRINAFIDPAICYAHPEIELAFITLFNTFGSTFFDRYHQRRPIASGFFETRRDVYNLYPLLVHTALFGGGYAAQVDHIARRFV